MSQEFDITVASGPGGGAVVQVSGELDIATAEELRVRLCQVLACHRDVVVDLYGVGFCDCSGLRALLAVREQAAAAMVRLRLRSVPSAVHRILQVTGLGSAFAIEGCEAGVSPLVTAAREQRPRTIVPAPREGGGFGHCA